MSNLEWNDQKKTFYRATHRLKEKGLLLSFLMQTSLLITVQYPFFFFLLVKKKLESDKPGTFLFFFFGLEVFYQIFIRLNPNLMTSISTLFVFVTNICNRFVFYKYFMLFILAVRKRRHYPTKNDESVA